MRPRNFRLLMLFTCCVFLLCLSARWMCAQTFSLQTGREPIVSLDGLWRFHTGDDPQWASTNFDDSQWPLVRSDRPWTAQGYVPHGGFAWYRFTLQVPDGSQPLALLLPRIGAGYRVYANGKLIGSTGSTNPVSDPTLNYPSQIFRLPAGNAGPQTIQIALRVWSYQPFATWIGRTPAAPGSAMGDPVLLLRHFRRNRDAFALRLVNSYAYCILAALVGLTVLGLFLFRRDDREYLWFAILLLAEAADAALYVVGEINSIPYALDWLLDSAVRGLSVVAALAFFSIVLRVHRSFLWWVACIAVIVSPLTVILFYFQWTGVAVAYAVWLCCLLPASIWILAELARSALAKDISARLLLLPAALFYGFNIFDSIAEISNQVGWQKMQYSLDLSLLHHPFPLHLSDAINYIFILALLIFLVRRFSLARQEETRLSTEIEAARGIQSFLVPAISANTPGFRVESVYIPASEVSGDFFQVQPGDDGSLLAIVGDVSGKGLKAAMTVSTIVGAVRDYPVRGPAEILKHLNRVLIGQVGGFVTCCVALIAPDGSLTIANAGHLPPYRNGSELSMEGSLPLGILAEGTYSETHFHLDPGDRLMFLSDGIIEARNSKGELYGFERTQRISHQPAAAIADTARQFGQEDDITVVSIEYSGSTAMSIA